MSKERLCLNTSIMNNYQKTSCAHSELSFHLLINRPKDRKNGRNQKIAEEEMKRQLQRKEGMKYDKHCIEMKTLISMKRLLGERRKIRGEREPREEVIILILCCLLFGK